MLEGQKITHSIKSLQGAYVFEFDGHLIPLLDLAETLGLRAPGSHDYFKQGTQNILVIQTELCQFALAVDRILDSEEIVVKSVGKHLDRVKVYAGVTFMGDGSVGLILSANGIAEKAGLSSLRQRDMDTQQNLQPNKTSSDQEYLLFNLWCRGSYAVPLSMIHRLEEMSRSSLQAMGERQVVIYREQTVPLIDVSSILGLPIKDAQSMETQDPLSVFVVMIHERYVAFMIKDIKDVCMGPTAIDTTVKDRPEILGCVEINQKIVSVLDIPAILDRAGILKSLDPENRLRAFAYGPGKSSSSPAKTLEQAVPVEEALPASQTSFTGDGWGIF
jgi:two-component system chemotaxis sensor kinase CheA